MENDKELTPGDIAILAEGVIPVARAMASICARIDVVGASESLCEEHTLALVMLSAAKGLVLTLTRCVPPEAIKTTDDVAAYVAAVFDEEIDEKVRTAAARPERPARDLKRGERRAIRRPS